MWLLHQENKLLHQLASIDTNDLFHYITLGCTKRKDEDVIKPTHLKKNKKTSPPKEKKYPVGAEPLTQVYLARFCK
jgi:hypothetical protein